MKPIRFHLQKRNEVYYATWYVWLKDDNAPKGKKRLKKQESLHETNKTKAQAALEKFIKDRNGDAPDLSCFEIEDAFNKSLETQGLDHKTIEKYQQHTKIFSAFICKKVLAVRNIRQDDIYDFLKYLSIQNLSEATIGGYKRTLRKLFGDFSDRDLVDKNPMKRIKIGTMPKRNRFYSQDELRKIIGTCQSDYEKALIMFFIQTGFRIEEVVTSSWEDINFDLQTIKIIGKRKKQRIQKIPNESLEAILKIKKEGGTIFGKKQKQMYKDVQIVLKRAGVSGYPHAFRDSYASYMLAIGVNPVTVRDRMGHSSLIQLDKYAHNINFRIDEDIKNLFIDWEIRQ